MQASQESTFYYNAHASALGGHLKQPLLRQVTTPATASLPQAGGFGEATAKDFHIDGLISIASARAHVSGSEHTDRGFRSTATATVEGLNIFNVVTADRLVAQLSIMHPYGNRPAEISLTGTQFVNLAVNGNPTTLVLDRRLFGAGRVAKNEEGPEASHAAGFGELLAIAESQYRMQADKAPDLVKILGKRFAFNDPHKDLEEKGSALATLVSGTSVEAPDTNYGHIIHVPDFGNIFLGELLVGPYNAQLTMVRVEMGCIANGMITCCSTGNNGRLMP